MIHVRDSLSKAALEAKDYRSLLRSAMKFRRSHRTMTLEELAKKSGFSSKGYISDLLSGRKNMTAKSMPRVLTALDLPKRIEAIFEVLVQIEEEDLRPKGLEVRELKLRLWVLNLSEAKKRLIDMRENS